MVLIIEGANFCGKTTIIDRWKDRIPTYRAMKGFPEDVQSKYNLEPIVIADFYLADFLRQNPSLNCLMDRASLSETIYQDRDIKGFYEWLRVIPNPVIVILYCSDEELWKRMEGREKHLEERGLTKEDVLRINKRYRNLDLSESRVFSWKIKNDEPTHLVDSIIENHFGV